MPVRSELYSDAFPLTPLVDFYNEGYTGDVDPVTGFAVVASLETCFVWKYSQVCL